MRKKYKVEYLPLFYKDLNKIIDYIVNKLQNKIAANNLLDEIEDEILKRSNNPEGYEKYNSIKNRKNIYYRIYVKNFIIFYTLKNDKIIMNRILYSRRNFKNLL